jgi:hypothetical protein
MNKNPTDKNASENITKICNPTETDLEKQIRISEEISKLIGSLQ